MRIVDRKTFLAMPSGTLFCEAGTARNIDITDGQLMIKGATMGSGEGENRSYEMIYLHEPADGVVYDEGLRLMEESLRTGKELNMIDLDTGGSRNAFFDTGTVYAVWSPGDMQKLIMRLTEAWMVVKNTPEHNLPTKG